jgi:urate oxidase
MEYVQDHKKLQRRNMSACANGTVEKLKVRIAIRGDLDHTALDEDNSTLHATF